MALAYWELILPRSALSGQIRAVGDTRLLPRPWEPATCRSPAAAAAVVVLAGRGRRLVGHRVRLGCWRHDSYMLAAAPTSGVRDCGLADQRRRAGHARYQRRLGGWRRYNLPALTERIKSRLRNHCELQHRPGHAVASKGRTKPAASGRARHDCPQQAVQQPIINTGSVQLIIVCQYPGEGQIPRQDHHDHHGVQQPPRQRGNDLARQPVHVEVECRQASHRQRRPRAAPSTIRSDGSSAKCGWPRGM
jgi:hypothetical protein